MHFLGIEEDSARLIAQPGIVGPTVPQPGDHLEEFAGAPVALVMLHMIGQSEIQRRVRVGGGDDVPTRAAVADVIERGEAARDMVRLVECRRRGGDQPDPLGDHRQRREQRQRLERGGGATAAQRLDRQIQHREMVRHEERVEPRAFQRFNEPDKMAQVEIGVREGAGVAPPGGMNADGTHERAQVKLPRHVIPRTLAITNWRSNSRKQDVGLRCGPESHTI